MSFPVRASQFGQIGTTAQLNLTTGFANGQVNQPHVIAFCIYTA